MKLSLLIFLLAGVAGCGRAERLSFSGGDGASYEQAVVIRGAMSIDHARTAEKAWLQKRYPSLRAIIPGPTILLDQCYDTVAFVTADGQTNRVHFKYSQNFSR